MTEVFSAPIRPSQHHRKGAIVLLVDDDTAVREVTSSILRELGMWLWKWEVAEPHLTF